VEGKNNEPSRAENPTSPAEVPASLPEQGGYREAVALAESLGYTAWELLEAVDCSGLVATLGYLQRESDRRRRELN
jgi:hypothetical protein